MRFKKLDLNLLVVLDALLQEQSVTAAADRVGLTQSATSSALGRLRDYFQDDLLQLKGRTMVLTPRGEEMVHPVARVLEEIRSTILLSQPFDPAVSDRRISILASDYAVEVLLRQALIIFEAEAPNMSFEISPLGDDVVEELKRGRADLLIALDTVVSTEMPSLPLWEDEFVVVAWSGNEALRNGALTLELYQELGHVVPRFGRTRIPSFEEWVLKSKSINRRCEVIAPDFTAIPTLVVETQRIATVHRKLGERMARYLPLRIMEPPFAIPTIRPSAQWSASSKGDSALEWVIGRLQQIAASPEF